MMPSQKLKGAINELHVLSEFYFKILLPQSYVSHWFFVGDKGFIVTWLSILFSLRVHNDCYYRSALSVLSLYTFFIKQTLK